jgi:FixJ family two-component response regulator
MEKTVFILDDDPAVRKTLSIILRSDGYKAACFSDEAGLREALRQRCPLAILLDVNLPARSGLEVLKDLKEYSVPVVMISGYGDIPTAVAAVTGGALDFLQKPLKRANVLNQLRNIEAAVSRIEKTPIQRDLTSDFPGRERLSRREQDVLRLLVTGSISKEIASALGISYRTVEDHRSNILHKLGVKNSQELLIAVLK